MIHLDAWLRRVERSAHAARIILRGSVVTRRFFPTRVAADVDHLVIGVTKAPELDAIADEVISVPDPVPLAIRSRKTLWADTPQPGLRLDVDNLQVDLGFGDPLTIPPERITIEGASVLAVRAESMLAWKLHGLVELGPRGRWRPKDLHDAFLYSTLALDASIVREAVRVAFTSHGHSVSLLRPMLDDLAWGASSGSRKRWRRFRKTVPAAPDLPDVLAKLRACWSRALA